MLHPLTSQRVKDHNQFIHQFTIRALFFSPGIKSNYHHFGFEMCHTLDFVGRILFINNN